MVYTKTAWVNQTSPFLSATNLNKLETGVEAATFRGEVIVAAAGCSTAVKNAANYVCDGVSDQVEINAAIDAAFASGGDGRITGVALVGGRFYISAPIYMKALVQVRGMGLGTSVSAVGMGTVGMFELADKNHHMTCLRDLTIWGNSSAGGTSHGLYYLNSDGAGDGNMGTYFPGNSPDASHRLMNLYVKGFSNGTSRHGLYFGDNTRDNNVTNCRVFDCSGTGFLVGGSDGKFMGCIASSCTTGWDVSGGSNQFIQCKTAYSEGVGWNITSSRAHLTGCHSQDSGTHGYLVSGVDPTLASCVADSNSRLSTTAYGMTLSSDRAVIDGFHAYDRNQSTNHQDRPIQFNGANDVFVTGSLRPWSGTAFVTGTPTGFVRLVRIGSTVYSVG